MAKFCGYCGAPAGGAKFCTSCGHPLGAPSAEVPPAAAPPEHTRPSAPASAPVREQPTPAPAPAAPPPAEPPPTYQAAQQQLPPASPPQYQQPYQAPAARPAPPKVNPFVGVPVGDYVRDGGAILCLFAAIGMPWDASGDASDHWWVVISALLAVASLALPYVGKAGLVPGWTRQHVRLGKMLLNVPFLTSVVAAIVNELVNVDDATAGGIGTGVAVGLAGVVLAVQPRQADEDASLREDGTWNLLARVAAVAAVALGLLTFVAFFLDDLLDDNTLLDDILGFAGLVLAAPALFVVVVAWPAIAQLGGAPHWRRVFATVGFTILASSLFALANNGNGLFTTDAVEKWNSAVGGTFVLGAAAALAVSRPQQRLSARHSDPVTGWVRTAGSALAVVAAGLGVTAVGLLLGMIDDEEATASTIVLTALVAVAVVVAVMAASLTADIRGNRTLVIALIGGLLLLSIITVAVWDNQEAFFGVHPRAAAVWFALPALAAYALTFPAAVRAALGPMITERPAAAPAAYQQPHQPPQGWAPQAQAQPQPQQPPAPPASGYQNPESGA